jgi:hypothetical protein
VKTELHDYQLASHNLVNHSMLARDASGPAASEYMLERFWLADSTIRIPQRVFNQLADALAYSRVSFLPV